ncbi:MAG: cation:proton antiporter [Archaeoglobaceae archaeon]|nr:cation:proton antiporter [Archaeoglobaceae archaeon]MDW7989240.1 cation:proton antiporter [Archaeoglobaceae archaeon]
MDNYALLAITLGFSALIALLFKRLGFSQVTGYLMAGIILGFIFQKRLEENEVFLTLFSDIAITLLVFEIGREIGIENLRNLKVLPLAILLFEVLTSTTIALLIGNLLELKNLEVFILALISSFSSTPVIFKILSDLKLEDDVRKLILTVAILDDVLAVLVLVLMPQLAFGGIQFTELIRTLFFSISFAFMLVFIGTSLLNNFFRKVIKPDEDIGIAVAISSALLFAVISKSFGFSPALGAFCAGLALSKHPRNLEISQNLKSIREIFLILFFVALGLKSGLLFEFTPILLIAPILIIIGRFFAFTASNWVFSKRSLEECVRIGFIATSVGEFGLVVVYEALRLGIVEGEFLSITAISIILGTVVSSKLSLKADYAEKIASIVPIKVKIFVDNLALNLMRVIEAREGEFVRLLILRVVRNVVIVILISILGSGILYIFDFYVPQLKYAFASITLALILATTLAISIKTKNHAKNICYFLVEKRGVNPILERILTGATFTFIMLTSVNLIVLVSGKFIASIVNEFLKLPFSQSFAGLFFIAIFMISVYILYLQIRRLSF